MSSHMYVPTAIVASRLDLGLITLQVTRKIVHAMNVVML